MTVYAAEIAGAKNDIAAAGRPVSLLREITDYDPTTGTETRTPVLYTDPVAVLLPPDTQTLQSYAAQFQAGTLEVSKVQMALMPAFATTPEPGDTLLVGAEEWRVAGVETLAPDGAAILHKVLVSR